MDIKKVLMEMINRGASDLHLKVATPPVLRINGTLVRTEDPSPSVQDLVAVAQQILTPAQRETFENTREIDFAFGVPGIARFRANFYVQRGSVAMVFRHVPVEIKSTEELGLPDVIQTLAHKTRGLILVTGTVGSGKSTTLASIVDVINRETARHVITVEDPIEFLHRDRKSIISQREIGCDTGSYPEALKHILRQDPDVILIGEIRDAESMKIALTAADTGHLVLSTMHTIDCTQTISRIISFFPPHQHQEIRYLLASTLQAVVSQRLVPDSNGLHRYPAAEILIATSTIRDYIREPEKTVMIRQAIQEGFVQYQMQTFDQALMQLYKENKVSLEGAMRASSNPHEFSLRLKGIQSSSDTTWDRFEEFTKDASQELNRI
ncbi:type IV pili twitching motility protein PilT [bacterium DOLZORAL124_64_63]|nr:MAG: type IV pili twitching motility protein PilT [bacterium DOLZORAL124_64_63]